jgi:phage-related protein
MAIGFEYITSPSTYAIPDRQLSKATKRKTLVASFGDGYEQRLADGINSVSRNFSLSFNNRLIDDIDDIATFLEGVLAITSFDYTYKDTNASGEEKTIKVVCDEYSVTYISDEYAGLTTSFREVFDLD